MQTTCVFKDSKTFQKLTDKQFLSSRQKKQIKGRELISSTELTLLNQLSGASDVKFKEISVQVNQH